MLRTLLVLILALGFSACAQAKDTARLKGYVRHNGVTYAVIESTTYVKPKVRNDYYSRAKGSYLQSQYGYRSQPLRVETRKRTRTLYVPVDRLR